MNLELFAREQLMEMTADFLMRRNGNEAASQNMKVDPRVWFINGELKKDVGKVLAPMFNEVEGKDFIDSAIAKAFRIGLVDAVVMLIEAWAAKLKANEYESADLSRGVRGHPKRSECIIAQIIERDRTRSYMQRFIDGRPDGDVIDLTADCAATRSRFDPPRDEAKHA
jgi:hypothetical protein